MKIYNNTLLASLLVVSTFFPLSIRVMAYDPPTSEEIDFYKKIKESVANADVDWLKKHIEYPINILIGDRFEKITDQSAFVEKYNYIINNTVRAEVLKSDIKKINKNYKGVWIGSGSVWFSKISLDWKEKPASPTFVLRIIAINNFTKLPENVKPPEPEEINPEEP